MAHYVALSVLVILKERYMIGHLCVYVDLNAVFLSVMNEDEFASRQHVSNFV